MGPLFQRRCKVLFSHRLDLTLIKLVNDETTLSENQLIHAAFISVNNVRAAHKDFFQFNVLICFFSYLISSTSINCQKMVKNACDNFPEPKLVCSSYMF